MRWYNKLKLVYRNYTRRVFVTILLFGMCLVSFIMIDKVLTQYIGDRYEVWQVEKSFAVNPDNVGHIDFINNDFTQEMSQKIYEYTRKINGVKCSGYILNKTIFQEEGDYILVQAVQRELAGIGNLNLNETQKRMVESLSNDEQIVFLGYNYRNEYKEGDFFNCYDGDDIKQIKVAGILDKGVRWIHPDDLFGNSYGEWDQYTLDNTAIVITDNFEKELNRLNSRPAMDIYFECEEDMFTSVSDEIKRYCYSEGISINVINYGDEITQKKEDSNFIDDTVFIAAIMITVLAIISVAASNVVYCLMSRKHYGIMLTNGMCKADIIWIIAVQNAIVMNLAAIAAWLVRQKSVFGKIYAYKEVEAAGRYFEGVYVAHVHYMPMILLGVVVILLFSSCIIPAITINKTSVADMTMGGGKS